MVKQNIKTESEQLYLSEDHNQFKGELALWRFVIIKALDDLKLPLSNKRYRIWQKQACKWLVKENTEFIIVCEYANISPEYILKIVDRILRKEL